MTLDRFVEPSNQHSYVSPYETRIFEYNTDDSNVFLSRVVNSIFRIFGNDIVIRGFDLNEIQSAHTDDYAVVRVAPGMLIQDYTLLDIQSETTLMLEGVSGLDTNGRLIVGVRYQFLTSTEKNPVQLTFNYVSKTGNPLYSWDHQKDRTVLYILEFEKDEDDNITNIWVSSDTQINVAGETYYKFGFDPNKKNLEQYLLHMCEKETGSSIEWQNGLSFINDSALPGPNKVYGTSPTGERGWFDIPTEPLDSGNGLSFTHLDDTPGQLGNIKSQFLKVANDASGIETEELDIPGTEDFVTIHDDQAIKSNKIFEHNVMVLGDLTVQGELTYLDQQNLSVENNEIILNRGELGEGVSANYAGLRVKRGTLPDALFQFDEFNDRWAVKYENEQDNDYILTENLLSDYIHTIEDEGDIPQFSGQEYKMKMMNGNIIVETTD